MIKINKKPSTIAAILIAVFSFSQNTLNSYTRTMNFLSSDYLQTYEGLRIAVPSMTLPNSMTTYTSTAAFGNSDIRQLYNACRAIGDAITTLTANGWALTGNTLSSGLEYLGTNNSAPLTFKTNSVTRGSISSGGDFNILNSLYIGTTPKSIFSNYNVSTPGFWMRNSGNFTSSTNYNFLKNTNSFQVNDSANVLLGVGSNSFVSITPSLVTISGSLKVSGSQTLSSYELRNPAGSNTIATNGAHWYDSSLNGFTWFHNSNGSTNFAAFTNSVFTANLFIVASTSGQYNMQISTSNTTGVGISPHNTQVLGVSTNSCYSTKPLRVGSSAVPTATVDITGTMLVSSTSTLNGIRNNATFTTTGAAMIGGTTAGSATLHVLGTMSVSSSGTIAGVLSTSSVVSTSKTEGIGYAVGSGSTVTQGTSRTTGVTINDVVGSITLFSTAGSATWQSFTMTNSTIGINDLIIVNQRSGTDLYMISVTAVAAGSCRISFATTGGTTSEAPVFNFAVIKGATN